MKNLPLSIRFGLVTAVCLIAYFLILAIFNLHTKPILSLFNFVITGFGIFETINYSKIQEKEDFNYFNGFKYGLITGITASLIFSLFFVFFATRIDTSFLSDLLLGVKGDTDVKIGLVGFTVLVSGLCTTLIMTLTCMQYFKTSRNITQKV